MFVVENNNIVMTKGDSGSVCIKLQNSDGTEFVPGAKDVIRFSVKRKKENYCDVVLEKTGSTIRFEKGDTESMASGKYVYDIIVEKSTGERHTAVEGILEIRKAVHDFG